MRYHYRAVDAQHQEVSGHLEAGGEREAARLLRRRGLDPLFLAPASAAPVGGRKKDPGRPRRRDLLIVLHELATLLESEVPLIEAVESLAESGHHPFITARFTEIAGKLRQGGNFSGALGESGLALPWYMSQLVEAGELTGKLGQSLRDGVAQMEYDARISEELRSAMIYPVILIVSGISAILLIFILVVPRFANILKNRGDQELPWLAEWVLNSGMFLHQNFHLWLPVVLGGGVALVYAWMNPGLRARLRDTALGLPIVGEWILEAETGRWAAMLGTLLENRVALMQALELSMLGIQLPSLKGKLTQVSRAVRAGAHLSQALQEHDALTPTGQNLVRAGERAGKLPPMLKSLAKLYEESSRTRMKRFLLLIEPIAILFIGAVIGLIITGVILAITSVNQISF